MGDRVLVPVEPTGAMLEAAHKVRADGWTGMAAIWSAMIAAAPFSGEGEPVAWATCQACGGRIEGWVCQSCNREFRENDAGGLIFDEDHPGKALSVEEVAELITDHVWADANGGLYQVDEAAQAILAAMERAA